MSNFNIEVFVQNQTLSCLPGKITGKSFYQKNNISPEEFLIVKNINSEVDIPIHPTDVLILKGGEEFFVTEPCSDLPENPVLFNALDFKLNGQTFTGENGFNSAKISLEELLALAGKSCIAHRVVLDLENMADQVLPDNCYIIVGQDWSLLTTPLSGDPVDLEDCDTEHNEPAHSYRINVDGKKIIVDVPHMMARDILELAGLGSCNKYALYQKFRGGFTKLIEPNEKVDFTAPGIERFVTIPLDMTEGFEPRSQFQLSQDDTLFLNSLNLPWEAVNEGGIQRVIIHNFPVPDGYNHTHVKVNMRLDSGYPDTQIDMAYFYPALARTDSKQVKAIALDRFDGLEWQRWSRHRTHLNPWRPGIDNISTHVSAVSTWLASELEK